MIATLFGICIVILPFIGVLYYEDRLKIFSYIFISEVALSFFVAILSQYLGIFTYSVIVSAHIFFLILWLVFLFKKKKIIKPKNLKPNWLILLGFSVPLLLLLSIHYRYTGVVNSVAGTRVVQGSFYPYPFYSDEWVGVSLVNYAIESKSLPIVNPLFENRPFPNYLLGLHSLLAYFFLLFNIHPLTSYAVFAILNTFLVSLFVYLILRLLKIGSFSALVSAMSVVFITNSGNLPGLWNLLPYNASFTLVLFSIIGFLIKEKKLLFPSLIIAICIYPPMIVFIVPLLVGMMMCMRKNNDRAWRIVMWILAIAIAIGILIFSYFNLFHLVFRQRLDPGIVSYEIWNVIPLFILPFMCVGVWRLIKEKNYVILLPLSVGIIFWIIYIFVPFVFAIEQSRVVVISAILLVLGAGIGIDEIQKYVKKKYKSVFDNNMVFILKSLTLIFFIIYSVFSSRIFPWHTLKLVVHTHDQKQYLTPAPPVTRYLTSDDLSLFEHIKKERFLAPPWKGLVIGAATNNFPLDSKTSTISNTFLRYDEFMKTDCKGKVMYAKKFSFNYVYATRFSCNSFEVVGQSREGLVLYKYNAKP